MFYKNCFHSELDSEYVACPPKQSVPLFDQKLSLSRVNPTLEARLPNEILIYRSPKVVQAFQALVKEFHSIWESQGFVNIVFD